MPPTLRAKATAEMESELKPLAAASVTPGRAISCVRAEQRPVPPKPRAKAAAETESELKPLAAASVTPGRAISCVRQREVVQRSESRRVPDKNRRKKGTLRLYSAAAAVKHTTRTLSGPL